MGSRISALAFAALGLCSRSAQASPSRWTMDLELVHVRNPIAPAVDGRYSALTVSAGVAGSGGVVVPFARVAFGLMTAQLALGAWVIPRGWGRGGPIARAELRPEISMILDGSAGLMAACGAGYRWLSDIGRGRYVLVVTEAGPSWIPSPLVTPPGVRREDQPSLSVGATTVLVGFTVVLGMDW